jgi:hypothetical protein
MGYEAERIFFNVDETRTSAPRSSREGMRSDTSRIEAAAELKRRVVYSGGVDEIAYRQTIGHDRRPSDQHQP